ncbi:MAG: S8 family serine peptidase [Phycisphaerae bacterium]|nr:S8 family serine peptidase [Phycisphaerae bacterium]
MARELFISICLWVSLVAGSVQAQMCASDLLADDVFINPEKIVEPFEAGQETTRVIVNLARPETLLSQTQWDSPESTKKLRKEINNRQNQVLQQLTEKGYTLRHRFENLSGFSAEISLADLEKLANHPMVESIEPVYALQPHLAQGISLMNGSDVRMTYGGQGVAIAVCDTGIDYNHPALGGGGFPNDKVIGGYDFGDNDANPIPNTQAHGTCCAGIAAGDVITVGDYIGGVAYNAKLYALKITYGTSGSAYNDDIAAAWDWCVTHKNDDPNNPILVISTSFGGDQFFSACDNDSVVMTTAADNAVAAGITVLVSSGNDGYCNAISSPACISSIISVGAVYDASLGTYGFCVSDASCAPESGSFTCYPGEFPTTQTTGPDVVTVYSNTASFLDVLAPSHDAYTTDILGSAGYSTGDYDTEFGGTSAACPYAAGAVACIQSAAKSVYGDYLAPEEIRELLTSTGDDVLDDRVDITKPRVNLANAVGALGETPPVAKDMNSSVPFNTSISITLQATDEGLPDPPGALTYRITSLPNHGMLAEPNGFVINSIPYTLADSGKVVVYTPKLDCGAAATFTFMANDGGIAPDGGDSNEATVTLSIVKIIYSANMDTNPGWTLNGSYWAWGVPTGSGGAYGNPDPTSGYTGANVVGYNLLGDYKRIKSTEWATTPAINCSGLASVVLRFYRWLNVEDPEYDHAYIQVSNNGTSWDPIWENTTEITDSSWTRQRFDISAIADNQPTVYVRWGMGTTDNLWHYSGWNIDDVQVWGASPAQKVGDFEPDCDVDVDDLNLMIAYWLQVCGDCQGTDLLADGIVNLEDFVLFAQNWLTP